MLHLAWTLTQALAADDPALATEKLGLTEDLPLPILLPLSAYALHLRNLPANAKPEEKTLAAFISRYQIEKQTSFELPPDFFQQLLRSGRAVILLLDGLDEVPNEAERVQVRSAIEDLVIGRDNLRAVVTCRMAAYKERTALGKGFQEVRVQLLDEDHLNALVGQAYTYLYHHDPQAQKDKTNELLSGIRKLEQERQVRFGDEVEPLVASPLMVRMLLVVHYSERRLPDQRAELYMKATDAMLLPEYAPDETVADQIGGLVGGSREVHRELAQHLAFAMHERGEAQGREISEDDLRTILHKHPLYANLTDDFIALTRLRGTLLEERLGAYRFLHLAFQEFLAARYLAEIVRSEAGVAGIARFFADGPILDSWWREPALLTVGYLTITSPQTAQLLLRHLAGLGGDRLQDDATASERSADIQLASAEAAAIAALEWPGLSEALSIALAGRLGGFFRTSNRLIRAKPVWRAAAGAALARLGDPRQGVSTLNQMEFCYVPAGPFRMGSPGDDDLAYDDEKPLHQHELAYGYWLARYPVTVAQYRAYVESSGRHPQVQDSLRDPANHPVVYVSWREALDFCNWLTNRWQGQGFLPTGWAVRLPSEAEWEKGARGGLMIPAASLVLPVGELSVKLEPEMQQNPAPGRRFPWGGDEPDPGRMNFDQTGINATNTVGCFPNGASPYGCEEMSGNVWEWTRSLWGKGLSESDYKYPYDPNDGRENLKAGDDVWRVVRGGAFDDFLSYVRCAARGRGSPDFRSHFVGFRVLVSPIPSSAL
jgi:formylglycine-generating enzyme required for sulfatase activity